MILCYIYFDLFIFNFNFGTISLSNGVTDRYFFLHGLCTYLKATIKFDDTKVFLHLKNAQK